MRARLGHGVLALGGLAIIAAGPAHAATGSLTTAMGQASAQVVVPISLTATADLDFGDIASDLNMAGQVMVDNGGPGARFAGGAHPACASGVICAVPHPARFDVQGEAGRSYVVSTPSTLSVTGVSADGTPAPTLTIDDVNVRTDSQPDAGAHGQLDAKGQDRFAIGARLEVKAGTGAARYRVQLPVVVTYG